MKKFSAFSGYDSQGMVFPMETVGTSEVDEWAILTAAAIHYDTSIEMEYPPIDKILERFIARNISYDFKKGVNPWVKVLEKGKYSEKMTTRIHNLFKACILTKNFGDISLINPEQIPDHDLFTYSFPCQDISMAGLQKGLKWKCVVCGELYDPSMHKADGCPKCGELEADKTRSSLLWECQKIIELKRPKYLMMENVKNLVGKKHKSDFDRWLKLLEDLGYNNYWKVINAKNCGVPQNRERVFCVSILKSVDDDSFKFLDDFDNGIRLKDILEDNVDEKYYLSEDKTESLIKSLVENGYTDYQKAYTTNGNAYCIDASYAKGTSPGDVGKARRTHIVETNNLNMVGMLDIKGNESIRRVYEPKGLSPALTTMQGGNRQPKIVESFRIRKLTPTECFRLMGVKDSDIDKIKSTEISNSQMYKLAGNSIVVPCMNFLKQLRAM